MPFLEERDLDNVSTIPEYYKGKTVFITGGSGFMGKVLIEKLLYSCSDLDRIYLLLRNKKGVKPEDRLDALYESQCFDRLRNERPGLFQSKVFFIAGDASEPGLGISEEDRALIINRTNIIFHAAASVRFDDPLKVAVQLNLRGTIEMLELAKEIRDLESFVHISTSYANTNRDPIEEVMYPPLADWRDTLKICDAFDNTQLNPLTAKYLGDMPNTYGFTKQLAENVVYEYKGKLPIVIVRPSIVVSGYNEPMPGWIENFNGPVGLLVASGKGILRCIYSKPDIKSDYITVDFATKCFIAASWIRGTKKLDSTDDIPIYNSCSGDTVKITLLEMLTFGKQIINDNPMENALWSVGVTITPSLFYFNIQVLLFHLLPAIFVDMVLWLLGKKPMLVKIQRRIYVANLALRYYISQQWTFTNTNFMELRSKIKEEDKKDFYYDLESIDVYEFYKVACGHEARRYLKVETEDSIEKNKTHYRRLKIADIIVKTIFYGLIFWWISKTEFVKNLFPFV